MTTALLTRLSTARSLLAQLRVARSGGNPNHDSEGRFAAGPGKGGKHHAKRVKRRKKKLEQLRKEGHKEISEFRVQHRKERRELIKDQAKTWKAKRREHVKERNALRREHKRDKTPKTDRIAEHKALRQDQKHERQSVHEDHVTERRDMRSDQHDDRREVIDRLKYELHEDVPGRSKTGRKWIERDVYDPTLAVVRPVPPGQSRAGPGPAVTAPGRLSRRTTHKAGTAEAILAHCLRRRGWTARFAEGRLTGRQHLVLLNDVRQYGRAWLRHEAEELFRHYSIDRGLAGRIGSAVSRFFDRARSFIRELTHAGAMALKGGLLTDSEVVLLDGPIQIQLDYLRKFEQAVNDNPPIALVAPAFQSVTPATPAPMSAAQVVARAEQYGNSVWQTAINTGRQTVVNYAKGAAVIQIAEPPGGKPDVELVAEPPGVQVQAPIAGRPDHREPIKNKKLVVFMGERRVHFKSLDEHPFCVTCKEQSDLGWQPLGSLNEIGDSECGGGCDCYFEWRAPNGAIHVSPWFQRHNPKGYPTESETGHPGEAREGKWIGSQGNGQPTNGKLLGKSPVPPKAPRKIIVKPAPPKGSPEAIAAKEALQASIIDAEVKLYLAGKPTTLNAGKISPRIIKPIPAAPAPSLYYHAEAEYDAAGNLVVKDFE